MEAWIVDVQGLRDASDYARVCALFSGTSGVQRMEVAELRESTVRLRMIVEGGVDRAIGLLAASREVRSDGAGNYVFTGR